MDGLLLLCGLLCIYPMIVAVISFQVGKRWKRFEFRSPIVVKDEKGRDKTGFGDRK